MLRMTHPSRNFFVLSLFCVLCMFVWLLVQGFESSDNKVFQKEKIVNSKTIISTFLSKEVSSAGVNLVQMVLIFYLLFLDNRVSNWQVSHSKYNNTFKDFTYNISKLVIINMFSFSGKLGSEGVRKPEFIIS
jgi:hypothetical protein